MNKKNKVEKKRQKEQYVVEEMIRLYCRKNHKEHDKTTGKMCLPVRNFQIMPDSEARNVHLWKKKHSVRTVRCIAISQR